MLTFNERPKDLDHPRYHDTPLELPYVLLTNQLHPQNYHMSVPQNMPSYQNPPQFPSSVAYPYENNYMMQQTYQVPQMHVNGVRPVYGGQNHQPLHQPPLPLQQQGQQQQGQQQQQLLHQPQGQHPQGQQQLLHQPQQQQLHHQPLLLQHQPQLLSFLSQHLIDRLQDLLPQPPLALAPTRPDVAVSNSHKRTKRKLKFSKRQDELIVRLKKEGRPWVEIAEVVGVGSYLAARNRYQVIVGQQGNNNSSSWTSEDRDELQKLLDLAEVDKWQYIAQELSKATEKTYSAEECREHARTMFWQNPAAFGVSDETVMELHKEKRATERLVQQSVKEEYDY